MLEKIILMHKDKKKFFVDAMLGNVAKKLRFFGYDTLYSPNIEDEEILVLLQNDNRILITKDEQLSRKASKQNIQVILLSNNKEVEQLVQIKSQLRIEKFSINPTEVRCTLCNSVLTEIDFSRIQNQIPENVLKSTKEFWKCNNCNKIYWVGTHIIKLGKLVDIINEQH